MYWKIRDVIKKKGGEIKNDIDNRNNTKTHGVHRQCSEGELLELLVDLPNKVELYPRDSVGEDKRNYN